MSTLGIFAVAGVMAVHQTGLFELDGDSISHNAAPPNGPAEDWNDVFAGTDSAAVTTGIVHDPNTSGTSDNQFDNGSKDIQDISAWHYKVGVPPSDKTDLENAYAALYSGATDYLYLGADRVATNGDAKLGFWILQDHITLNADGTFSGEHKVGDVLIESAYTNGGGNLGNINVYEWEGADGAAGHLSAAPIFVGADCRTTVDPNDFVCSINNDETIHVPWTYQGKKLGNTTPGPGDILAGGFNETGVNLSHFFPNGIPCFSNVLAETRAAGSSVSSSTEDFVLGTFQTCGTVNGHKYLDVNGNGALDSGEPGLGGWTINLFESDGTTLVDSADTDANGDVTFSDIEPGDYVVCEELQTGWTNTDPGGGTLCKNITIDLGETETVNFGNGAPDIDVTKEADSTTVCENGTVTYTYTVTNTGNVDLSNVVLTDDLLGVVGGPITLAAGDDETFTATSDPISGEVKNTVTATGNWDGLTPAATATADETVTSDDCTISVTKSADQHDLCTGGSTTYDFSITNNSASFNWTGTFVDDVVGDIGGGTFSLLPGETKTFTDVAGPPLSVDTTNTVTADGAFDDPDATAAGGTASDTVNVDDCTITLTKTPDQTAVCNGTTVTYTYTVTNNSDQFTWTGSLVDDKLGTIADPLVLLPGETKTFTASTAITGDVVNTATADGAFDDPDATAASDQKIAEVVGTPCGQGCTPGFWQGGFGIKLWNQVNDPDWVDAGGAGTNPFATTDLFSSGPWGPSGISSIDSKTMLQIVGTGGGSSWPKKAARDLVAAYLNASFLGSGYPYDTATILSDWADAVAAGTSGFQAFHLKYSAANELGCTIGQSAPASAVGPAGGANLGLLVVLLPLMALMLAMPGWRRTRRSKE